LKIATWSLKLQLANLRQLQKSVLVTL